jgi:hypothetical protein
MLENKQLHTDNFDTKVIDNTAEQISQKTVAEIGDIRERVSEQLEYGIFSSRTGSKRIEIKDEDILAKSVIKFYNNGDSTSIQTDPSNKTLIYDGTKISLTRRQAMEHDFVEHGIAAPEFYASGITIFETTSKEEESLLNTSAFLRRANYLPNFNVYGIKKFIIELESKLSEINNELKLAEDKNAVDQVDILKYSLEDRKRKLENLRISENKGVNEGLSDLYYKLKYAEKFISRVYDGVQNGMNLEIENIVTEKPNIPDAVVDMLSKIKKL